MSKQRFYFFERAGDNPGVTVTKKDKLPDGEFAITEYTWTRPGYAVLWFVDADKFTARERERAFLQYLGAVEPKHV